MSKEVGGMVGSRRVKGARRATGVSADGAAVGTGALATAGLFLKTGSGRAFAKRHFR